MTEHLAGSRLAECVSGSPGPGEQLHLHECAQCREEVARLQSALGHFRQAMHAWSAGEGERALARTRMAPERRTARIWFRWQAVAIAALVLAMAPLYKTVRDRQRAAEALADAQLLEQVNREVSGSVPTAMEPLAQLVSWDSAAQDGSQDGSQDSSDDSSQNGENQ